MSRLKEDNRSESLKTALCGKNLRLATSFWDFIDVKLYTHPDKYEIKDMHYWLWSELKQQLQEYKLVEHFQTWEFLKEYVEGGICYVRND